MTKEGDKVFSSLDLRRKRGRRIFSDMKTFYRQSNLIITRVAHMVNDAKSRFVGGARATTFFNL